MNTKKSLAILQRCMDMLDNMTHEEVVQRNIEKGIHLEELQEHGSINDSFEIIAPKTIKNNYTHEINSINFKYTCKFDTQHTNNIDFLEIELNNKPVPCNSNSLSQGLSLAA